VAARKTNALDSFTGKKKALGGTVGKPQDERQQEVWTPPEIWAVVLEALGGVVHLDPCASSRPEGWRAALNVTRPGVFDGLKQHGPLTGVSLDALAPAVDWDADNLYMNPPFNDLRAWLTKAVATAATGRPAIALVPVRPRRVWWCNLTRTGERVYLAGVKFVGFDQAHPENMCLVGWNCTIPPMGALENERIAAVPGELEAFARVCGIKRAA
jgi:hypothetical protein